MNRTGKGCVSRDVKTYPCIAVLALAAALSAACSSARDAPAGGYGQAAPGGRPPTVEELAAKVGCEPKIQIEAAELRQGHCRTSAGEFFLTTFATQQGKDEWMDAAPEYNPHLVGNLWTALSSRAVLERVRQKLGGDLHLKDHRTGTPAPG
ncbi:hypothetical protein [Planomonospora venezuelensis]|uniref:Putative outer membrane protein n=1 Tax=Planomonospora venezuelensis TaxID=1999 RepID=A0A841D9H5_PLAVE|nr:hypothetical protein [Planomonospora venezuelensis]MBB5964056.1 putative outer membrane protein [Planomonospora venezuelensis]GIM99679.1 hypothetical protein Pve01_13380 [Planomonospora venezuelensis]